MKRSVRRSLFLVALIALIALSIAPRALAYEAGGKRHLKVLLVTMFEIPGDFPGEQQLWLEKYNLNEELPIPGLSPNYPNAYCNKQEEMCLITTDEGYSNAATSVMAALLSGQFDLKDAYIVVAGIAGVDPKNGTTGSVSITDYVVDGGLAHLIDVREVPKGWTSGFVGFGESGPSQFGEKPTRAIGTEFYMMNPVLTDKAYELYQASGVPLNDSETAQQYRANYTFAPANQPPSVIRCTAVSSDTWTSGNLLSEHLNQWVKLWTDGKGDYCMTDMEDAALMTVFTRASAMGLLDVNRVIIYRAGSDFDGQIEGFNDAYTALKSGLSAEGVPSQGGFLISAKNLVVVASPLVDAIRTDWKTWQKGIPAAVMPMAATPVPTAEATATK